jgi:hypothetical protein
MMWHNHNRPVSERLEAELSGEDDEKKPEEETASGMAKQRANALPNSDGGLGGGKDQGFVAHADLSGIRARFIVAMATTGL